MIKITIQNTETGEKFMAECDAYVLATMENVGSVNEAVYTSFANESNYVLDAEELIDAIIDRLNEDEEEFEDDCDDDGFDCHEVCGFNGTAFCDFCCGD